jgi:hypothetical protein
MIESYRGDKLMGFVMFSFNDGSARFITMDDERHRLDSQGAFVDFHSF